MATYEELMQSAEQIRTNELPESNTHELVGQHLKNQVEYSKNENNGLKTLIDNNKKEVDGKLAELGNKTSSVGYVVCTTAANIPNKALSVGGVSALTLNIRLVIKMTYANTSISDVTLTINSLGAKPLYYNGERVSSINTWSDGEVLELYYDGNSFYSLNAAGGSGDGGNKILTWNVDAATTRRSVKVKDRKVGMQISYLHPDEGWINEQYVGIATDDINWGKDANWNNLKRLQVGAYLYNKVNSSLNQQATNPKIGNITGDFTINFLSIFYSKSTGSKVLSKGMDWGFSIGQRENIAFTLGPKTVESPYLNTVTLNTITRQGSTVSYWQNGELVESWEDSSSYTAEEPISTASGTGMASVGLVLLEIFGSAIGKEEHIRCFKDYITGNFEAKHICDFRISPLSYRQGDYYGEGKCDFKAIGSSVNYNSTELLIAAGDYNAKDIMAYQEYGNLSASGDVQNAISAQKCYVTSYIDVTEIDSVDIINTVSNRYARYAFYDKDKVFISVDYPKATNEYGIQIPEGAYYMRFTMGPYAYLVFHMSDSNSFRDDIFAENKLLKEQIVTQNVAIQGLTATVKELDYQIQNADISTKPMLFDMANLISNYEVPLSIHIFDVVEAGNNYVKLSEEDAANFDIDMLIAMKLSNGDYKVTRCRKADAEYKLIRDDSYDSETDMSLVTQIQSLHDTPRGGQGQHLSAYGYRAYAHYVAEQFRKRTTYRYNNYSSGFIAYKSDEGSGRGDKNGITVDGQTICMPIETNYKRGGTIEGVGVGPTGQISTLSSIALATGQTKAYISRQTEDGSSVEFPFELPVQSDYFVEVIACNPSKETVGEIEHETGIVSMTISIDGADKKTVELDQNVKRYIVDGENFKNVSVKFTNALNEKQYCLFYVLSIAIYKLDNRIKTPTIDSNTKIGVLGNSWTEYPEKDRVDFGALQQGIPEDDPDMVEAFRPNGDKLTGLSFFPRELARCTGAKVDCWGKGGSTSENWGLVTIDEALNHTQYDIMIIEFYINDFNGGMPFNEWKNNIKTMCEKCIKKGVRPVVLMPTWTASAQQSYNLLRGFYYLLDGFVE